MNHGSVMMNKLPLHRTQQQRANTHQHKLTHSYISGIKCFTKSKDTLCVDSILRSVDSLDVVDEVLKSVSLFPRRGHMNHLSNWNRCVISRTFKVDASKMPVTVHFFFFSGIRLRFFLLHPSVAFKWKKKSQPGVPQTFTWFSYHTLGLKQFHDTK